MLPALEAEPAMEPAPRTAAKPRLRIEPRRAPAEVTTLVVAAWIGKKRYCEARVLERTQDGMTVLAAAPLEQGEQVWFNENDSSGGLFVRSAVQEGSGFRLGLHREKRRSPRWRRSPGPWGGSGGPADQGNLQPMPSRCASVVPASLSAGLTATAPLLPTQLTPAQGDGRASRLPTASGKSSSAQPLRAASSVAKGRAAPLIATIPPR